MAEFKTYTCDLCGKQGALRLTLLVDRETDACGDTDTIPGYLDLCADHMSKFAQERIGKDPITVQRSTWKAWLDRAEAHRA